MSPRFNFTRLLCFVLLVGAFLVLGIDRVEAKEGLASWYGLGPQGRTTASGQPYDPNAYTTAHRTLPFGTQLRVNYRGRSVPVTVNDRGPYTGNRELDLSQAAARDLGLIPDGVGYVDYDIPGNPEDLSWGMPQQTGLTRGVAQSDPMQETAQQPYPSQGRAQQPASLYLVEPQPIPAEGAAQLPEFARGPIQPPDLSQGTAQQPGLAQEPAQVPVTTQEATQVPMLTQTWLDPTLQPVEQHPSLPQVTAQEPTFTQIGPNPVQQAVEQQPDLMQRAEQQPSPSQGVTQELGLAQEAAQQPPLSQQVTQGPRLTRAGGDYPASYPNDLGNYPADQDEVNGEISYVVQPGDTLSQIAARLGVPTDYLAGYNGITDPNVIYSGQPLYHLVGLGEHKVGDDVTIGTPLDMRNDPTVDEEGVVQSGENAVVTAPASEGRELLWGYSGVVVPHGTTIGGERRQLPATGGGWGGS